MDLWTCDMGLRVFSFPAARSPKLFCTNVKAMCNQPP